VRNYVTLAVATLMVVICCRSVGAQAPDWYPTNFANATCAPVIIARVDFRPAARGANSDGTTTITTDEGKYQMMTSTKLRPGDKGAYCFPGHDHEPNDTFTVMVFGKIVYLMRLISN
jgi:hypothetical protein